jgi:hypothetical protein
VAARLRRLHPDLAVTFCRYAIDPRTSRPIEVYIEDPEVYRARVERRGGSDFLVDPGFHLWIRDRFAPGKWLLVKSYPADWGFGHREVAALEGDLARFMRPQDIARVHREAELARRRQRYRAQKQLRREVAEANMGRIRDLVDGKDRGTRQAKISSFGGQTHRGTPGEIRKDNREDGWDLPDRPEY